MKSKLKRYTLENGLNIYFYKDNRKHSTRVSLVVKYGGLDTDFKVNNKIYHMKDGIPHLLEHLIYERNRFGNFFDLFGKKQMHTNALTSNIKTEYFFDTVEYLDFGIETLIKGVNDTTFTKEDVEGVKDPIYQEARMCNDNKYRKALEISLKNSFNTIPFVSLVGRSIEDIKSITYEEVKLCYETFYRPDNEFMVVVGNFDQEHVLNLIKTCFNEINKKYKKFEVIKFEEKNEVLKSYEEYQMPVGVPYTYISYKIPISNIEKTDRKSLELKLHYFLNLNFGIFSPVYKELIKDKIIYEKTQVSLSFYLDFVFLNISSSTNNSEEFINKIKNVFEGNYNNNYENFELLKKNQKINLINKFDYIDGIINLIIYNVILYNYHNIESVEDVDNIGFEEYINTIDNLDFKNYTIVKITDK